MSGLALDTSGAVVTPHDGDPDTRETVFWADLDAFTQGYIEASWREWGHLHPGKVWGSLIRPFGFSDLAPEALAQIIADCAAKVEAARVPFLHRHDGRQFWAARSAGAEPGFPPLTPYLGDDGKVHLREVGQ